MSYFEERNNPLLHCCATEPLRLGRARMLRETDGGAHGASHYVTGRTPLDYARYRDVWLPIIKALG